MTTIDLTQYEIVYHEVLIDCPLMSFTKKTRQMQYNKEIRILKSNLYKDEALELASECRRIGKLLGYYNHFKGDRIVIRKMK